MNELADFCKNLKKDFTPKIKNSKEPVKYWSETEVNEDKPVDSYVIIFRTSGCEWAKNSGCSMCGYFNDSIWEKVSDNDLLEQLNTALETYSNEKYVKIFTSGSFFDDSEIKPEIRKKILSKLYNFTDKVSVESRPDYINNKNLTELEKTIGNKTFEISIGLETSNDFVREKSINKGFTFNDYKNAVKKIKKQKMKIKTYILIKPPFLTEKESIEDCKNTFSEIKNLTDTVSFNPTNVQKNTVVEYLWRRNQYRPPWLWSIVDILKTCKKNNDLVLIKCDIAGGGKERGAHNCKNCNKEFLKKIGDFSLNQDEKIFDNLNCDCKDRWLDQIDMENITFGSMVDFSRNYGRYL